MFKLVMLYALLAAAFAEPSAVLAPLAYSTVLAPATTTISRSASSVVHPYPLYFSAAPYKYSHFIKKRSAPLLTSYIAPSTYYTRPAFATTYAAPLTYRSPFYTTPLAYAAPAHFIKKRSVGAFIPPTRYIAPSYSYGYTGAPFLASTYAASVLPGTPIISSSPFGYSHFIKKRSAPLLGTYLAPAATSYQSRIDLKHSAPFYAATYTTPLAYASPFGYSHIY